SSDREHAKLTRGCERSPKAFAKQFIPVVGFRTKCFRSAMRLRIAILKSVIALQLYLVPATIQIALQNHLRCHLIHVAAGVPRFLTGLTQCPVGGSSREPLIPGDDRAGENRA